MLPPDPRRKRRVMEQVGPIIELGPEQRALVERTITETCDLRRWELFAINVRTNHVHLVVSGGEPPERMMNALKAW